MPMESTPRKRVRQTTSILTGTGSSHNTFDRFFLWFLHLSTRLFPNWTDRARDRREREMNQKLTKAKKRYDRAEEKFREAERKYRRTDQRYKDAENRFKREEARYDRARDRFEFDEYKRSLRFAQLDVEPHEVNIASSTMIIFLLILFIVADLLLFVPLLRSDLDGDGFVDIDKNEDWVNDFFEDIEPVTEMPDPTVPLEEQELEVISYTGEIDLTSVLLYLIVPTIVIPLVGGFILLNYPLSRAKRLRIETLGKMPEAINYMATSMRLSPSLDRAIEFAAENVDEPLASNLKKILWDIYIREYDSIEEAFIAFAYDWGEWNDDFKRSLYAIRSSTLERTEAGLEASLDKACDIILYGTKNEIEGYANSLSTPMMMIFALGLMLPMIIAVMLPFLGLGMDFLVPFILIMLVLFPLLTFYLAYRTIGRRPGTTTPPQVPNAQSMFQRRTIFITSMILLVGLVALGIFTFSRSYHLASGDQSIFKIVGSAPIVWGVGLAIANWCLMTSYDQKKERDVIKKTEEEFPDALFQLGSRIAEHKPLEKALEGTSLSMKGTHVAWLFRKMTYNIQVKRGSLREALFGKHGVLHDLPSPIITATMQTVVESIKKDPVTAGRTLISISGYLRELKRVENDVQHKLSQVLGMMSSTVTFFGPIIIGISSTVYFVLGKYMAEISASDIDFFLSSAPIPSEIFSLIIEIFLILITLIVIYLLTNIEYGSDWIEWKAMIGVTIPIVLLIYSATMMLSKLIIPF